MKNRTSNSAQTASLGLCSLWRRHVFLRTLKGLSRYAALHKPRETVKPPQHIIWIVRKQSTAYRAKTYERMLRHRAVCRDVCAAVWFYLRLLHTTYKCCSMHRTSLSSSVCRHLQANPDDRVDFHNPEVIGSDNNWRRLQILESLLIQEHKPELNANIPSIPLCIFNL